MIKRTDMRLISTQEWSQLYLPMHGVAVNDDGDVSQSRHLANPFDQNEDSWCLSIEKFCPVAKYNIVEKDIYPWYSQRMERCHEFALDLSLIATLCQEL